MRSSINQQAFMHWDTPEARKFQRFESESVSEIEGVISTSVAAWITRQKKFLVDGPTWQLSKLLKRCPQVLCAAPSNGALA